MIGSVGFVLLAGALLAGLRYGVLLPQARLLIEAQAQGLRVGRFGRLHVEGLQGDIWRHFTLRRLTVADEGGIWVEARDLDVSWRFEELLNRRLHVTDLRAGQLRLIRRPTLTPKGVDRGLPVSFQFDRLRTRVEMLPAFSYRRGVYRLDAAFQVARAGGSSGRVRADSEMHAGDFLQARFDVGRGSVMQVDAHAREALGGAIAGSLGLAPDRPFLLDATISGTMSNGRFNIDSRSGALVPLWATGAWTPQGGQGRGTLLLSSSTLLRTTARMFGPSAQFNLTGRRAPTAGLYTLGGTITSENLRLSLAGDADIGRQLTSPRGVALDISIGRLSRLATWPEMGGGLAQGRIVGTAARWTFTGTAQANQLATLGFALDRVNGPLTVAHENGQTLVDTRITGTGGRGRSILAAMLGARPAAQVSATWTREGQLLLRRVTVQGPGVAIDGQGARGILGDLAFRGSARLSNFDFAHPQARGLVNLTWSAAQSRSSDPWRFTVDGRGENFAAGLGEVDRLLGAAPRFQAAGNVLPAGVQLTRANLDGTAGSVSGSGLIGNAGALQLALDWRARGPFRAGPMEVSGDIWGTGRVSGTMLHPRADLTARLANVDLPMLPLRDANVTLSFVRSDAATDGQIAVTATSQYGPARGAAAFDFRPGGLTLSNLDIDAAGVAARGSVSLIRGRPAQADLTYTLSPGLILVSGTAGGEARITDSPSGPTGRITLRATNATFQGGVSAGFLSVEAVGPLTRMALEFNGESNPAGVWRAAGRGTLAQTPQGFDLALNMAGRVQRADFRTTETALVRIAGDTRSARLRLALSTGNAALDLTQTGETINASAVLRGADLGLLNEDLAGLFDANINLQGRGRQLSGDLVAALQQARAAGARVENPISGTVRARLSGDVITIDADARDNTGLRSAANLVLPAEASAAPFRIAIARQRPMRGTFSAQGQIAPIWTLLMGGDRTLAGMVDVQASLAGTLADPRLTGMANLSSGQFTDTGTGLRLTNLGFRANLANNAIDVADLTGQDGARGRVTGSGRISLQRSGVSSFRLSLQSFRLLDNEIGEVQASGDTTINRDASGQVQLAGALTVDRAEIAANPPTPSGVVPMDVVEINRPVRGPPQRWERPRSAPLAVGLDVTLRAPRAVFVRGRGLNLELALNSHVTGTSSAPRLEGIARVVRGDYDLAGRRFQFDQRGTIILSTRPEQIRLDLTATREDPALTASVKITGTAARPRIELTSTPALPPDEILSRVLFGQSASQLSPYEAAQLASSLAAIAGGGGLDVIGNLRNLANLDRLSIGGTELTGVTVSGGRYVTDNVYIELTGGGRDGPAAQVEWRARRGLSIISRLRSQGDASISIRWRRDYGADPNRGDRPARDRTTP